MHHPHKKDNNPPQRHTVSPSGPWREVLKTYCMDYHHTNVFCFLCDSYSVAGEKFI